MPNPRLTPYQTDLLGDARRLAGRDGDRIIDGRLLRSKTASQHLVRKGYMADAEPVIGPRGGVYPRFVLTTLGVQRGNGILYQRKQKAIEFARKNHRDDPDAYAARRAQIDAYYGGAQ